jgi:hypothetical protein
MEKRQYKDFDSDKSAQALSLTGSAGGQHGTRAIQVRYENAASADELLFGNMLSLF